jgi:hydroxymethylpyrimidine kinase/phosphomethylpyrimidine kinase
MLSEDTMSLRVSSILYEHSKRLSAMHRVSLDVSWLKCWQVMVSTSGSQLLPQTAVSTLIGRLLPLTTILTPNLPEAKLLLETAGVEVKDPENVEDIVAMAHKIQGLGPRWVLLKGGHLPLTRGRVVSKEESEQEVVLNVLVGESGLTMIESEYVKSDNTHGTGCSLACKLNVASKAKRTQSHYRSC